MNILNKVILFSLIILSMSINTYALWHEAPIIIDKEEDIDKMWWLSKKKKEELKIEQEKRIEEEKKKHSKKYTWYYDESDPTRYPKNKWEILQDANDGNYYRYYFDKDGYVLIDTITPDYKVVDKYGREVDSELNSIKYDIKNSMDIEDEGIVLDKDDSCIVKKEPASIIISEGVILHKEEKIYDNSLDKDMLLYIEASDRFIKETRGTTLAEVKWKNCSSIKGNGGYIIFDNPHNNFNKVTFNIAIEYYTNTEDTTKLKLLVYDANKYDEYNNNHHIEDLEEIYSTDNFNEGNGNKISFTFDRSINRLRFVIEVLGFETTHKCLIKNLKYGFSKSAFIEELERKINEETEIEELKRLGIYVNNYEEFEKIDENGEMIDEDIEETVNENNDDVIGGISYESYEETKSFKDTLKDKISGPYFDNNLKNEHTWRDSGPAFIEEFVNSTNSNIK